MSGETKKTAICLVGLASLCAMFRAPFFGTLTVGVTSGFSELRVIYDLAIILLGCLLAALSLLAYANLLKADEEESVLSPALGWGSLPLQA